MHEPFVSQIYGQIVAQITTGAINQDGGRLVHHHRVLCLILTSVTQPTWRECCIYWRNNQTYKVYSKLSVTSSHEFKTRKWNKVQHAYAVRVAPPHGRGAECSD